MRVVGLVAADLAAHAATCGDRVVAIALSLGDHHALSIVEIWGLPVLAWNEVDDGRYRLLCDAEGVLIQHVHTFEELADRWAYDLQRPVPAST